MDLTPTRDFCPNTHAPDGGHSFFDYSYWGYAVKCQWCGYVDEDRP